VCGKAPGVTAVVRVDARQLWKRCPVEGMQIESVDSLAPLSGMEASMMFTSFVCRWDVNLSGLLASSRSMILGRDEGHRRPHDSSIIPYSDEEHR